MVEATAGSRNGQDMGYVPITDVPKQRLLEKRLWFPVCCSLLDKDEPSPFILLMSGQEGLFLIKLVTVLNTEPHLPWHRLEGTWCAC